MDLYKNGELIQRIPVTIKRKGYLFTRLIGFNVLQTPESFEIHALYKSLFGKSLRGDVIILDIVLGRNNLSIFLYPRFPFVLLFLSNDCLFTSQGEENAA